MVRVPVLSSLMKRIAVIGLAVAGVVMWMGAAPGLAAGAIRWHSCGADQPSNLQCGDLSVPLNYSRPHGAKITLGFNRLRAQDRAHRIGSLIFNPGGPGAGGSDFIAVEAAGGHLLHPSLHERFDLIGMDPRGIGRSTPVKCDPAVFNRPVSLFPRTQAEFDQVTAWAGAFGASCLKLTGPLLAHVDTGSVARDMERLRRALGDEKLNFLGLSYGAHLGSTYAELYPKRIRVMALDAIANHALPINTLFADATAAYEDEFNRFASWCEETSSCPLHGRDVAAMFDELVARADRHPIPAPGCADAPCRPTVTGGEIRMNLLPFLLVKDGLASIGRPNWGEVAGALLQAEQGDATAFSTELPQSPTDGPFGGIAVNCIDYPWEKLDYDAFSVQGAVRPRPRAPHPGRERGVARDARLQPLAGPARPPVPPGRGARRTADPAGRLDARPGDQLPLVARDARPHRGLRPAHARR